MARENDVVEGILTRPGDELNLRVLTGVPHPEFLRKPRENPGKTPQERLAYWLSELRYIFAFWRFSLAEERVKKIGAADPVPSLEMLRDLRANYLQVSDVESLRKDAEYGPKVERAFEGAEAELSILAGV